MFLFQKVLAEALGTFLLIFTINVSEGEVFAVAGALFNPAVSLACIIKRYFTNSLTSNLLKEYTIYTIVQFLSGFLGALSAYKMTRESFYYDYNKDYPVYKACITEAFYTAILCFIALNVGKCKNGLYLEGFIVIIVVITGAKTIGHLTRNCLNPVVGLSCDLIYYLIHGRHFTHLWVYLTSPMIGGALGALANCAYCSIQTKYSTSHKTSLFFSAKSFELQEEFDKRSFYSSIKSS